MEAYFPHFNIRMGCELGRTCMLIYMVTMANAATSPIILPFALWWFLIGWIFWRYGILYVFERSTESGGMVRSGLPAHGSEPKAALCVRPYPWAVGMLSGASSSTSSSAAPSRAAWCVLSLPASGVRVQACAASGAMPLSSMCVQRYDFLSGSERIAGSGSMVPPRLAHVGHSVQGSAVLCYLYHEVL